MSIQRQFSRSVKRIENVPQRALYKQTKLITKKMEKLGQGSSASKPSADRKGKIAIEVLWFFASIVIAILLAFLLFSIIAHMFTSILNIGITLMGSVYNFYYLLLITCFLGIYIVRVVNWALKTTILHKS